MKWGWRLAIIRFEDQKASKFKQVSKCHVLFS